MDNEQVASDESDPKQILGVLQEIANMKFMMAIERSRRARIHKGRQRFAETHLQIGTITHGYRDKRDPEGTKYEIKRLDPETKKSQPVAIPVWRNFSLYNKGKYTGEKLREIRRKQTEEILANNFGSEYLKDKDLNETPFVDLWSQHGQPIEQQPVR